ncbi:hypothetical protein VTN96DRAFT_46 [Rasamsonia emersonii]
MTIISYPSLRGLGNCDIMKRGQAAGVSGKEGLEQMRSRRRFYQVRAVGCYLPEMCQTLSFNPTGCCCINTKVSINET